LVTRREFLSGLAGASALAVHWPPAQPAGRAIHSVTGPIAPDRLGRTLMHEHVLVDFIGADRVSAARYDRDEAFRIALPQLERVRALGCTTLVECTPAFLGRDPVLLRRLSLATGLNILTNTGYYGAASDKFVPAHARAESATQLADRWSREAERGIDDTGIRPAFMKIGVDPGPLSPVDEKLVRAAALTHRRTGLPIASHTGDGVAALAQLEVLRAEGVQPCAFIWVHAQNERDHEIHVRVAKEGAWVEFDGISERQRDAHLQLVMGMRARSLLGQVLISQDAGWYHVGEPGGGQFRGYAMLFEDFLPRLGAAGATADDIEQLMVHNPRRAIQC
jgi:phosphotriesterase-related protein